VSRIFYGPWDWLVTVTSARQRRAFGGWTFIISLALAPFLGDKVFFVTALSLLALIPNLTSETPVETEDE